MSRVTQWCWAKLHVLSTRKLHLATLDKPAVHVGHLHHAGHKLFWHKVTASAKACAYVCVPVFGGGMLWDRYSHQAPPEFVPFIPEEVPEPQMVWTFAVLVILVLWRRRQA